MRNLLIHAIELYQATLSPDHGPFRHLHPYGFCRHEPTCSEFARQAIRQRGAVVGIALAMKRLLSCHPWNRLSEAKILNAANAAPQ